MGRSDLLRIGGDQSRFASWLERPLSAWWCFVGWCIATAAFVVVVRLLGGEGTVDTYESVFSTWAIAHGQLTCAFPQGYRVIAPIYPILSGGIAAIGHFGSATSFPGGSALGPHCSHAFTSINAWSLKAGAVNNTVRIAYIGWPILMAGLIAVLRSANRGKRGWEPTTVVLVALLPPVWLCIEGTFHPQDLIAMGLALAAVSCVFRDRWVIAGILVALAVLSQQFAVLVAAPLLVLAPGKRRIAYAAAGACTILVVSFPFILTNFHGALDAILFGTGNTGGIGGTVLWELDLHGTPLVLLSRILPIALGIIVAAWAMRHLKERSLEPGALMAIVALSLSFRLIFEQQLFGYYFMAVSVALVMLDVVQGRLRASLLAWIATLSMVYLLGSDALMFLSHGWYAFAQSAIPIGVMCFAGFLIFWDLRGGKGTWSFVGWIGMIAAALLTWNRTRLFGIPPTWAWQIVFVPLGVILGVGPLRAVVRNHMDGQISIDQVVSSKT